MRTGDYRGGMTAELMIPAETVFAHRISPSLLTLDDEGNLGVKIVNELGQVEFHLADIAMSSSEGVWIAGLPHNAMIITVGQGFVNRRGTWSIRYPKSRSTRPSRSSPANRTN